MYLVYEEFDNETPGEAFAEPFAEFYSNLEDAASDFEERKCAAERDDDYVYLPDISTPACAAYRTRDGIVKIHLAEIRDVCPPTKSEV